MPSLDLLRADFGLSKSLAQNEQAANSSMTIGKAGVHDAEDGLEGHEIERWVGCILHMLNACRQLVCWDS